MLNADSCRQQGLEFDMCAQGHTNAAFELVSDVTTRYIP